MNKKIARINELVKKLNDASKAYYQDASEIMSNFEYDALYDELAALEAETGIVLASSPTVNVGYEVLTELPKERHEKPMLSLDKTKDVQALKVWVGDQKTLLSWKLDGLTIVLTYRDGKLTKAVTRGNGEVGEVITNNAKVFKNDDCIKTTALDAFLSILPEKDYRILSVKKSENKQDDNIDKIEKLSKLKEKGIITDEEFNKKKEELLNKI